MGVVEVGQVSLHLKAEGSVLTWFNVGQFHGGCLVVNVREQGDVPGCGISKLTWHLRPPGEFLLLDNNFGFDFTLDSIVKGCWEPDQKH